MVNAMGVCPSASSRSPSRSADAHVRAGSEGRTRDLSFTKALLYQLSYPGVAALIVTPLIANWHHIWHHQNEIGQMTGTSWP